jgi:hypothetical protein
MVDLEFKVKAIESQMVCSSSLYRLEKLDEQWGVWWRKETRGR